MTRGKMITPPVKGIDLEQSLAMAVRLGTGTGASQLGVRAVGPVIDGAIAYASEAMLPGLASLALLARNHPDRILPSADGWRIAIPGDAEPREISLLLTCDDLAGGWLVRSIFRTALSAEGRERWKELADQEGDGSDTTSKVLRLMGIDHELQQQPEAWRSPLTGDPLREVLISAVDIKGPPPGAGKVQPIPDVCEAKDRPDQPPVALRIRPQPFSRAAQEPIVSSSESGQHAGLAALVALSGLIEANGLGDLVRERHAILSQLGWKQFGDLGHACLLSTGMAVIGGSQGFCDAAAAARLGRFAAEMIALDVRRVLPLLPEIAQSLVTEQHRAEDKAWQMPGGRVAIWLDCSDLRIICQAGGARYALPVRPDAQGVYTVTSGAIEVARLRPEGSPAARGDDDHVGGGAMPPPIRAVADILVALEVAHKSLGERHRKATVLRAKATCAS